MKISVIVPSYNEERAIADCIASLYSQTRRPDEVLVVDDSTDSTPQIVLSLAKKYKGLRLVRGLRRGVSAARNLGAKEARGDVLLFIDSDKSIDSNALEQAEAAFKDKGLELAYFTATLPDPKSFKSFIGKCYYVRMLHLDRGNTSASEVMYLPALYRRETFMRLGMFDETLRYFEDKDMAIKIAAAGIPMKCLSAKEYHEEPSNISEFWKQARWLGSSITPRTLRWRVRPLFYPLGPVFWLAFILSALLSLIYAPAIFAFYLALVILLVEFLRCVVLSRMVLPSAGYIVLSFVRTLIIGTQVLRRIAGKASSAKPNK